MPITLKYSINVKEGTTKFTCQNYDRIVKKKKKKKKKKKTKGTDQGKNEREKERHNKCKFDKI